MAEELYACIYTNEFPAQAMLRLRPALRDRAYVVMQGVAPVETLCSCNAKARRLGAAYGMTAVEVSSLQEIAILSRSLAEEAAAKAALLECAGTFSPRVEDLSSDGSFVCVVDIAGTQKLLGTPATIAKTMLDRIEALGITATIAVSGNFYSALCFARGMRGRIRWKVIACGEEAAALSPLPLGVLGLSEEHAETFTSWGIHTSGELAALPEKALIARLGQEGKRLRQLALGQRPHLFVPTEQVFALIEKMELDTPVELLDSLLFVVGVMLEQLVFRATSRVLALASVTITLALEGGGSHTRTVRPALPANDRQFWIKLLYLDLEAHPPQAAIVSLALSAETGQTSKVQLGLFSPQLPETARLEVTLARIRAIVGEECVGRAVLKDTHALNSFRTEPFVVHRGDTARSASNLSRPAMRELRPVESVTMVLKKRRPETFVFRAKRYAVADAYGPWVTSGDWWTSSLWSYHQWDVMARAEDGSPLCCCLLRDRTHGGWQMAGFYD